MYPPVDWFRSVNTAASKTDFGLVFLRGLFLYFLGYAWRPVFYPNIQVVSRRSRTPRSRRTVVVGALVTIPMGTAVFGIRPLLSAGFAAFGAVVAFVSASFDNQDYKNKPIRLSLKPVPRDQTHADQLWIGACVVVAAFGQQSLYFVVRDIFWPTVGPDASILRWMARFLLVMFCPAAMVLFSQRPKKTIPAQLQKN